MWNLIMDENWKLEDMELDHIKPLKFLTEDNMLELAHFTNIQPLPPLVNRLKSAKWNAEDEIFWQNFIRYNTNWVGIYAPFKDLARK